MIKVEHLGYEYPQKELYKDITFTIEDNQHAVLIGSNGTGKSTLISILINPEDYLYDGKLQISEGTRMGYVSQFYEMDEENTMTVFDYLSMDFVKVQNEMNEICTKMESAEDMEAVFEQYQQILDHFDAIGGNDYESNIRKQLKTANLQQCENLSINKLSGGEFKLVQILKEMIVQPNLLIMDEPDVFLDFDNLDGLKNLINTFRGTMLVITHNRFLLSSCFNKILHLENKELQEFEGNYVSYNLALLQTKIELSELAAKDTEEIERNKNLVEKLTKDATNFNNAAIGRSLKARKSIVERLEARRIKAPFVDVRKPEIHFSTSDVIAMEVKRNAQDIEEISEETEINGMEVQEGHKDDVISVTDYGIGFEDTLLEHVTFSIGATDKVALIGPNGTGKTTLLRKIYEHADERIHISSQANLSYLSQIQTEMFEGKTTVADVFYELGFEKNQDIIDYLAKFCFAEEIIDCKVENLSGGERNLLQIAMIARGNANVLLLDEPTSHLDTYTQVALEKAIKEYNGALLMVSHDFYTVANCVDYVLLVEDKTVRKISGRKFRKMIYANHFDKDYLEKEQKRKELEMKVGAALKENDYEGADEICNQLESLVLG